MALLLVLLFLITTKTQSRIRDPACQVMCQHLEKAIPVMNTVMLYPQCLYHFYPMLQHILTAVHHLPLITIKISSIPRSFISIRCALLQAVCPSCKAAEFMTVTTQKPNARDLRSLLFSLQLFNTLPNERHYCTFLLNWCFQMRQWPLEIITFGRRKSYHFWITPDIVCHSED